MKWGHPVFRSMTWAFLTVGIVLLSISGAAALVDQPVGHLKIEERGEGLLNVEARCVPLTDIIAKLSPYLDAPVQLTHPCLTCVSMTNPDKSATAEDWLRLLAMQGAEFTPVRREDSLSLEPTGGKLGFDPGLSEAEIMERFATKAPAAQTVRSGIASGVLLYQGHYVPGPYKVDYRAKSDRTCDITINGLTVSSLPKWGITEPHRVPEMVMLPESGQFEKEHDIEQHITGRLSTGDLKDVPWMEARSIIWDFLETQDIVEQVMRPGSAPEDKELVDSDHSIVVRFNRFPQILWHLLPVPFDPDTRMMRATQPPYQSADEQGQEAQKRADSLGRGLGKGAVCVWSEAGYVELQGANAVSRLLDAIQQGAGRPVLDLECLLAEVVESRRMARELAVNLADQRDVLVTALEHSGHTSSGGERP